MGFGSNPAENQRLFGRTSGRASTGTTTGLNIRLALDKGTFAKLNKALQILPGKVFQKVVKQASSAAMTPMLSAAKRNVPVEFGILKKSLGKVRRTYGKNGVVYVQIGVREGKTATVAHRAGPLSKQTRFVDPRKYEHLVELGTTSHVIAAGKSKTRLSFLGDEGSPVNVTAVFHPGTKAQPFMRPAFESKKNAVVDKYRKAVDKGIQREVKKLSAGIQRKLAI